MGIDEGRTGPNPGSGELTPAETDRGLRNILRMGLSGQAMGTLAGGVFFVKVAVELDAPLLAFGLLAALPSLGQFVQLPAAYLVERYRNRKRITLAGLVGVRASLVAVALAPLVAPPAVAVTLILAAVFLQGAFPGTGWAPSSHGASSSASPSASR